MCGAALLFESSGHARRASFSLCVSNDGSKLAQELVMENVADKNEHEHGHEHEQRRKENNC